MAKTHTIPFEAYRGDEPYIFVSYSHADSQHVYPELLRLHKAGYRIWYDEGIQLGQEWTEETGKALQSAAFFIVFVSPNAVKSKDVRNEINLALEEKKPFLAIYLQETELPPGLKLQIGFIQAIMKYQIPEMEYTRRLSQALESRFGAAGPLPSKADTGKLSISKWYWLMVLALLISAGVALKFLPLPKFGDRPAETELQQSESQLVAGADAATDTMQNGRPAELDSLRRNVEPVKNEPAHAKRASQAATHFNEFKSQVEQARTEAAQAQAEVPGDLSDRTDDRNYQRALAQEQQGEKSLQADSLASALSAYQSAKELYVAARTSVLNRLKQNADAAQPNLSQARKSVAEENLTASLKEDFNKARKLEDRGHAAYRQQNYAGALKHYEKASLLFGQVQVAIDREEMKQQQAMEQIVKDVIGRFEQSIENKELEALRALCVSFTETEVERWADMFKLVQDLKTDIGVVKKERNGRTIAVDLLAKIRYKDNKNRKKEKNYSYQWILEQRKGKWVISKFQQRSIK